MDRRLLSIYLLMKDLGGFNISEINDRIYLQKSVYLLQLLGVDLRFRYSWYLRGPYSKTLTTCAYDLQQVLNTSPGLKDEWSRFELREDVKRQVDKLRTIVDSCPKDRSKAEWLELVASIHYLKHIATSRSEDINLEEMIHKLQESGKDKYGDEEIKIAWNQLDSSLDLIKHKNQPLSQ